MSSKRGPGRPRKEPDNVVSYGIRTHNAFEHLEVTKDPAFKNAKGDEEQLAKTKSTQQEFFERAVNAAWMCHRQQKNLSAPAIVSEDPELPLRQVREIMNTSRFKAAMRTRGIPSADMNQLSPEMLHLIAVLCDHSIMTSERTKCQKLGIPWSTYQGWLDYPPFEAELKKRMEKSLDRAVTRGDQKLGELIDAGNLNAITYANLKTGRFDPNARQMQSVSYIMSMVLTIIHKRVTDEATLMAIANDFARLTDGTGFQAEPILVVEERNESVYPPVSGDDTP